MSKFRLILLYFCLGLPLFKCKKFGFNNFYTCHCVAGFTCNENNGRCPGDCQQNVALNKVASQIHTVNDGRASFAVDGNRDNNVVSDQKCTDTTYQNNPWWRVDLRQTYTIRDINIVYRDSYLSKLVGFTIDVRSENGRTTRCYRHTGNLNTLSYDYTVRCNTKIDGRYVTITVPGNDVFMVLCEVEVYVCSLGTYGVDCNNYCHCRNNARCEYTSGKCPADALGKCQKGWTGSSCNQECFNSYGQNCESKCNDRHCKGRQDCNIVTGSCIGGCSSGYLEDDCTQKCPFGSYGSNCGLSCNSRHCKDSEDCDHETGKCIDGCHPGYKGNDCTQICVGSYGPNCASACTNRHCIDDQGCDPKTGLCSDGCVSQYGGNQCTEICNNGYGNYCQFKCTDRNCRENLDCNRTTGQCMAGCIPGYSGDDCTQECPTDTYGQDCSQNCSDRNCQSNNTGCYHITGKCIGGCRPGYQLDDCTQRDNTEDTTGDKTVLIASTVSVVIVIVIIIIIIIIVVIIRRRRSLQKETPTVPTVTGNEKIYENVAFQDQLAADSTGRSAEELGENGYDRLDPHVYNEVF